MTYTTEEKRTIAELRHESKMATLDQIAEAEGEYNRATATHKATLDRKIAEYELKAKNDLKAVIGSSLMAIRADETEEDAEGDIDE
jgi:predicted hotdog family 3-hydroxylacyl-ACP dehydratase